VSTLRNLRVLAGGGALAVLAAGCGTQAPGDNTAVPGSASPTSPALAVSAASDAKNSDSTLDLRRVQVKVATHRVTIVTRFYNVPSFDCGYVDYSLGVLNDVRVVKGKSGLRATAYRGRANGQQTVTGHPSVVRLSDSTIKVVVRRSNVFDFRTHGAWTALSTDTGCGLAGVYDSIPERGRIRPAHSG